MAKGKGKRSSSSGGPHKKHGPKKNMFHSYNKCIRIDMGKLGMLKKDVDNEALEQSKESKNKRKSKSV